MSEGVVYVQSIDSSAGKPVAVTQHLYPGQSSAWAIQHIGIVGVDSGTPSGQAPSLAHVYSAAGANALAVGLTDRSGNLLETLSVHAVQGGAPWSVTGSLTATQAGAWTVTATLGLTQLPVTQGGAPWSVSGSVQATVVGSVFASGVTSLTGPVAVTQQSSPWVTVGSVLASQGGAPWSVVASVVGAVSVQGSFSGTVVASCVGQQTVTASIAGNVPVSQVGAPWSVLGSVSGTTVASVVGNIPVTQVTSPWIVQVASQPAISVTGQSSVYATQVGSWRVFLAGGLTGEVPGLTATVRSWNQGDLLRVSIEQGTITGGGDGKILDRGDATIAATVRSYASGIYPLATQLVSSGGALAEVTSLAAGGALKVDIVQGNLTSTQSVWASQVGGPWTVVASVIGQATVTASVAGNLPVTQVTSPWIVQVASMPGVSVSVTHSVYATQVGAPWTVIGSVGATQLGAPWQTQATSSGAVTLVQGSVSGTVVASVVGQPTVTASVVGAVSVTQGTSPWVVVGSVSATAVTSSRVEGITAHDAAWGPNPVGVGGYALHPNSGAPIAVTSGDMVRALHDLEGRRYVYVASGEVGARQVGAPWSTVGSVAATQAGNWSVTASIAGVTVSSVVGNVAVTQVTSPWIVQVASQPPVTTTASVFASQVGAWVFTGSVGATQLGSPWTVTGSALVQGQVAHDAVYAGNPLHVGAIGYDVAQTSVTAVDCGDVTRLMADREGRLRVKVDSGTVRAEQVGAWTSVTTLGVAALPVTQSGNWSIIAASVTGQVTVTASVVGTLPVTIATMAGSVFASQVTSPWVVLAGSTGAVSTVLGSVQATQAGAWSFTGSVGASQLGAPWSISGSVHALTVSSVVGNIPVTQVSSPWVTAGSFSGTVVASVIGQPTVTASVVGAVSVTQGTSPWTVAGSFSGTVVSSVIGNPTVVASVIGNVGVSQVTSLWSVYVASTAATATGVSSVFVTQVGTWNVQVTSTAQTFWTIPDIVDSSVAAFLLGRVTNTTLPARFVKIAAQVGSGGRDYPYDGDYIADSVTTTLFTLDRTNINSSADYTGCLVVMMSGSATGHVRRLTTYSAAQRVGAINRGWDSTAVATVGDTYRTLMPSYGRQFALVRPEYSTSTNLARVTFAFYDLPRTPDDTVRAPQRYHDALLDLDNLGLNVNSDTQEASYWHGRTRRVPVDGAIGFKVHLVSLDAGSVSLWAAAI